jgi:hypothetical protein
MCTVTISFKYICAKSKRIVVEVYTERAENEEVDLEQRNAGATTLTSPQYIKNALMRKTAKRTQVETSDKFILTANHRCIKYFTFGNAV